MTNAQIRCYLTVVEEGSFAKAANTLFISQPAISKSISKMEDELGFLLLDRKVGALRPTAAGKLMYQFFTQSEAEYRRLVGDIQSTVKEPGGTVRLGCPETWNPAKFYDRIQAHFSTRFPSVKPEIECCRLPDLLARLHAEKLDLIMTHEFHPPVQYGMEVSHLTDTGCGILYSTAHYPNVRTLSDLNGVDFLIFDSSLEKKFGNVVRRICSEHGITPNLKNCGQYSSAQFQMTCGKGVMFFTDWDLAIHNTAYTYLPLNASAPVNLIYPAASPNPRTQLFVQELITLFSEPGT